MELQLKDVVVVVVRWRIATRQPLFADGGAGMCCVDVTGCVNV